MQIQILIQNEPMHSTRQPSQPASLMRPSQRGPCRGPCVVWWTVLAMACATTRVAVPAETVTNVASETVTEPATDVAAETAALVAKLTPHIGHTLDVIELGAGKRFVRPTLEGINQQKGKVVSLRLRLEGETKSTSLLMTGIIKMIAGRETIYETTVKGMNSVQVRSRQMREFREKRIGESLARMQQAGVAPWPVLTAEQQAAAVADLEAFVVEVRQAFPALQSSHTHEFLVATDIPLGQIGPFLASLDGMHDFLCNLYGIPRGEPVWKGKCLVFAFLKEDDFIAFEGRFMKTAPGGAHGICHQSSDGRVVMACHRGDDGPAFAHMLVHETSHGFNHRWMSPVRLPSWLNEGIAEWVGTQVVPACRQVPLKEAVAIEFMKTKGSLGPGFLDAGADAHIDAVQYGIASGLVKFLVARDRKKFAAFVQNIKEGTGVEESLKKSFKASLADLVKAYGMAIGVPNLKQ